MSVHILLCSVQRPKKSGKSDPWCFITSKFSVTYIFIFFQNSFSAIARVLSEFFRDLDVVPTDVIVGLVLLRQRQQLQRIRVVLQVHILNCWFVMGSNSKLTFCCPNFSSQRIRYTVSYPGWEWPQPQASWQTPASSERPIATCILPLGSTAGPSTSNKTGSLGFANSAPGWGETPPLEN